MGPSAPAPLKGCPTTLSHHNEGEPTGSPCVRPRPLLRHRLEYAAVVSVVALVRLLPVRGVLAAGTLLGRAFFLVDRGHRRLAIENLRAAFPVRTEAECRVIARDMFAHFGHLLAVLLKFSTMTPKQMLACVEFEGEERVIHAHAQGRGVLLFTGHFGFWEINALVHALKIQPMSVLARPLDNPLLHDLLESARSQAWLTKQGREQSMLAVESPTVRLREPHVR